MKQAHKPVLTLITTVLGGLAAMQGSPGVAATPSATGASRDEMVITARKKEELLIEVPIAVSAFDEDAINDLGLTRIDDIARFTPGFSFDSGIGRQPTSQRPMIRGLTTVQNGIANASSATVFVDGIYIGGSTQSTELYNLERAEVLRGPQTALYGRNTYAGAINYVTRDPTGQLTGEIRMTGAEHDTNGLTGWLSGPLIEDRIGFVISAGYRQYGGEYINIRDGSSIGGEKSSDITTKLRWTPTESIDITLKTGLQNTDDEHFAASLQSRELNNCCFRSDDAPRAREYFIGEAEKDGEVNLFTDLLDAAGGAGTELDRKLVSLSIDWDFLNGYTLTSLTGYIDDDLRRGIDTSYAAYTPRLGPPGLFTMVDWVEQSDLSQELRLQSPDAGAVRWTGGLYYYQGESEITATNRVFEAAGNPVVTPVESALKKDEIENFAVFGGIEWDFIESWTATIELRWATDRVSVRNTDRPPSPDAPDKFTERYKSLNPRFTLSYEATDNLHYYLNVAKGTKPGFFNSNVPDEDYRAVDEETVWNYEIGTKSRWWQQRLSANLAAFYLDVDDQQLTQIIELPDDGIRSIIQNVGSTSVYGIEAEFGAALTENFNIGVSYAWTQAEYDDHISTDEADLRGWDGNPDTVEAFGDVSGNELPRVPEHMASVVMRYERPFSGDKRWYISGDYSFESSRFAQEHNLIETGDRSLVGLRAGLKSDRIDASIWATNLLDDDTPVDIQRFFDTRSGNLDPCSDDAFTCDGSSIAPRGFVITLPRGRQVGATVSFRF